MSLHGEKYKGCMISERGRRKKITKRLKRRLEEMRRLRDLETTRRIPVLDFCYLTKEEFLERFRLRGTRRWYEELNRKRVQTFQVSEIKRKYMLDDGELMSIN